MNSNRLPDATYPTPLTSQYYLSHLSTPEDILVEVCEQDFERALSELVPSVSQGELEHYQSVRALFEGNLKKVDNDYHEDLSEESMDDEESLLGPVEKDMEPNGIVNGNIKGKGKMKDKGKEKEILR